jgi:hypothetical protein
MRLSGKDLPQRRRGRGEKQGGKGSRGGKVGEQDAGGSSEARGEKTETRPRGSCGGHTVSETESIVNRRAELGEWESVSAARLVGGGKETR